MPSPSTTWTTASPSPSATNHTDYIEAVLHIGRDWEVAEIDTCIEDLTDLDIEDMGSGTTSWTQTP